MFQSNTNKSSGQASRTLLIIAIIVLVAVVITYSAMRYAEKKPAAPSPGPTVPQPVYEATLGDIRFVFQEARDFGSTLKGSQSKNPQWQQDLKTTERFVKVTVGAQNKGKENTKHGGWDIENIVDSEGRNYVPASGVDSWLPEKNTCGELLKPEFAPTSCTKIYEVSKVSTGLKIRVKAGSAAALLDLIVTN